MKALKLTLALAAVTFMGAASTSAWAEEVEAVDASRPAGAAQPVLGKQEDEQTPVTLMRSDEAVEGLSGDAGTAYYFQIYIAPDAERLALSTFGGDGDADVYLAYGRLPQPNNYDYVSNKGGAAEKISIRNPRAGTWYVLVFGYEKFADLSLTGSWYQEAQAGYYRTYYDDYAPETIVSVPWSYGYEPVVRTVVLCQRPRPWYWFSSHGHYYRDYRYPYRAKPVYVMPSRPVYHHYSSTHFLPTIVHRSPYAHRDGDHRSGGFDRRDGDRRSGGSDRRDGDHRSGGFDRRDGDRRDGGFDRRDGDRRDGGFDRRDGDRRDGGFDRRDGDRRDGGFDRRDGDRRDGGFDRRDGDHRSGSDRDARPTFSTRTGPTVSGFSGRTSSDAPRPTLTPNRPTVETTPRTSASSSGPRPTLQARPTIDPSRPAATSGDSRPTFRSGRSDNDRPTPFRTFAAPQHETNRDAAPAPRASTLDRPSPAPSVRTSETPRATFTAPRATVDTPRPTAVPRFDRTPSESRSEMPRATFTAPRATVDTPRPTAVPRFDRTPSATRSETPLAPRSSSIESPRTFSTPSPSSSRTFAPPAEVRRSDSGASRGDSIRSERSSGRDSGASSRDRDSFRDRGSSSDRDGGSRGGRR